MRTAVEERTGWNLDRKTGSAALRKLFSEVLEELHPQFWSQVGELMCSRALCC